MVKSKSPKVFSYFLFMQEQRKNVPGWANKTNNELQALCDPLWRKLDREEKDKYKQMKKAYKEKERMENEERYSSLMHSGTRTCVIVGHVEKPDVVWVTKTKDMDFVQNQLSNMTMVPIDEVKVGTIAACKFSEDDVVYRAQVLSKETSDKVMIRYLEFGNSEIVDQKELCHLPSSLGKVGPMAVKVRLVGMEGVKNTEKNRRKVEKKLDVDNLEVSVDKDWLATFYSSGVAVRFKGSKSEPNEVNLKEKTIQAQVEVLPEVETELVTVRNVERAVDESEVEKFDYNNKDYNSNVVNVEVIDSKKNFVECDDILAVASANVSIEGQEEVSTVKSSSGAETDSGIGFSMTMESLVSENEYKVNNEVINDVDQPDEIIAAEGERNKCIVAVKEAEDREEQRKITDEVNNDHAVGVLKTTKSQTLVAKSRNGRNKKIAQKNRKDIRSGWNVGDAVVAQWEDGVWRQGVLHELNDDMAFVVSKEEMVKATKVRLAKLRHSTIPVDVLNIVEDELMKSNGDESNTDESSSIISSCDDESDQVNYSEELVDLLELIPLIDIETLISPSCTNLISSLVQVIPTLSVCQLDMLVESMMVHDLLVPAAFHPETSLVTRELVRSVMKSNSVMRGQLLGSLAVQSDEMQLNVWGKEVLKTLQGYI